jgi:Ca2+-binding RTX toxin-like protein
MTHPTNTIPTIGNDELFGLPGVNNNIDGLAGDDLIFGGELADTLVGGLGNDTLVGGDGNDLLSAQEGNDFLYGGNGNDTLNGGVGNDFLQGGFGNDVLNGLAGNDTLDGDEGNDFLDGSGGNDSLLGGNGQDTIVGADDDDIIFAGDQADALFGGNGQDTLVGDNGNDFLQGGLGNDALFGGNDDDTLDGDDGNDFLQGGLGNDVLLGSAGSDTLSGDEGNDSLQGGIGADTVSGGNGNDTLVGDDGNDLVEGGAGNDALFGGNDNDTLNGGEGNDIANGGQGNDSLNGGIGNDTLTGSSGADIFAFRSGVRFNPSIGVDNITDFSGVEGDQIQLSKTTFTALQSFNGINFSSPADFAVVTSNTAAEASNAVIVYNSTTGELFYNTNGSSPGFGEGGSFAVLNGAPALSPSNFLIIDAGENPNPGGIRPTLASISNSTVVEGNSEVFDVRLSSPALADTVVNLTLNDVTANLGPDYNNAFEVSFDNGATFTATGPAVAVRAGVTDFRVRLGTLDDTTVEPTETFRINASTNGTTVTGIGTITDNDVAPAPELRVISVGNSRAVEGQSEIFDVTLSGAATSATRVRLDVFNDNAQLGVDYSNNFEVSFDNGVTFAATGPEVTVRPGATGFRVRLSTTDDNVFEPNETFRLNATINNSTAFGTGTIVDNDPIRSRIVGTQSLREGERGNYTIRLEQATDTDRFFTVQINDGSARRFDGDGSGQDIISGGAFDDERGRVFEGRVPNDNINSNNNRAAVGPGDATRDYTVLDAQGNRNNGNTIVVRVAAGQTVSDQFLVQSWRERVTVDRDYRGPRFTGTAIENTENLSLKIIDGAGTTVTQDTVNVSIADASEVTFVSPIAIDLNGDGIQTLSIDQGVKFDLLNTGEKVSTGWLSGQDGFLAVDANGNGQIDNRNELFGGGVGEGFAELATFDSDGNGLVNSSDSLFGSLSIWQDANENGVTDQGELQSLASYGVAALNTSYSNAFTTDAQGNVLGETSSAITTSGKSLDLVDVYFKVQ